MAVVDPGSCKLCKLGKRLPNTKIVLAEGNPGASLFFVGEAPGQTEAYQGRPFIGDAGRVLDDLLQRSGIQRSDAFISNVCKCWPWKIKAQERTGSQYYTNRNIEADEVRACRRFLEEEIRRVNPRVIVALGGEALSALEGKVQKITKRVGIPSIYKGPRSPGQDNRIYIVPTYHPAHIARNGGVSTRVQKVTPLAAESLKNLQQAKDIAENRTLFEEHKYLLVDSREKLEYALEIIRKKGLCSFDIETTGLSFSSDILGIGFGVDVGKACYIPFLVKPLMGNALQNFWEDKDITRDGVIAGIKTVLEDPEVRKSAHNAKFDMNLLEARFGIVVQGLSWDTMCGAYIIDENSPHGLKELKNVFIDLLGYSEQWDIETNGGKNAAKALLTTAFPYCCGDNDATYRITKNQYERFLQNPTSMWFMENFYVPLMEFVKDFENYGVLYDVPRASAMYKEYTAKSEEVRKEIFKHAGVEFNIDSPIELRQAIFTTLGLKHKKRTKTKQQAADEEVMEDLAKEHIVPKLVMEYRHLNKMRTTYMESFIKEADAGGRLHLPTNPIGTVTGRPSSEGLMNIPREVDIKSLFIAPPGSKLVQADLSQAEVRCFAHYSNEEVLQKAFEVEGTDVHCIVAAEVLGIPYEEVYTRYKAGDIVISNARQTAKSFTFGILYGRGPQSIAKELNISLDAAMDFINKFFKRFPNCKRWIDDTIRLVHKTGEVQNILGRIRRIPAIFSSNQEQVAHAERQAVNSVIQSTASDITCLALIKIHKHLKANRIPAHIVLTVYDSIITETRDDHVEYVRKLMKDTMEAHVHPDFSVKMRADLDVYQQWGRKMKKAA